MLKFLPRVLLYIVVVAAVVVQVSEHSQLLRISSYWYLLSDKTYIRTAEARLRSLGENLVTNPAFSFDGSSGLESRDRRFLSRSVYGFLRRSTQFVFYEENVASFIREKSNRAGKKNDTETFPLTNKQPLTPLSDKLVSILLFLSSCPLTDLLSQLTLGKFSPERYH